MEFGILFTSHPNHASEPYPHRDVHARVTREIQLAEELGYDTAWIAEHHFSNQYGIMPDVFAYLAYLSASTSRIRLGAAVVTVPLYDPIRVAENMAFIDILSNGRLTLGLGSGYRPYEFAGFGRDFEARRDVQEEAIDLILELIHKRQSSHSGPNFRSSISGDYEVFPVAVQSPHPPLYMAAGTERSISYAARHGFGLMLSTLPSFPTLAPQIATYRRHLPGAPSPLNQNPASGNVDIARMVYVAETDEAARAESEEGILRHIRQFQSGSTAGYLGSVSEMSSSSDISYDNLQNATILHGSPETVIRRLRELEALTGMTSLLLHYPPYYGYEKAMKSLRLFAEHVMPAFKTPVRQPAAAAG